MSVVCFPKLGAKLKPPWNLKSCVRSMQILLDIQLVWKAIESQPTNRTFNLYYVGMYLPTTVAGMLVASALGCKLHGISSCFPHKIPRIWSHILNFFLPPYFIFAE